MNFISNDDEDPQLESYYYTELYAPNPKEQKIPICIVNNCDTKNCNFFHGQIAIPQRFYQYEIDKKQKAVWAPPSLVKLDDTKNRLVRVCCTTDCVCPYSHVQLRTVSTENPHKIVLPSIKQTNYPFDTSVYVSLDSIERYFNIEDADTTTNVYACKNKRKCKCLTVSKNSIKRQVSSVTWGYHLTELAGSPLLDVLMHEIDRLIDLHKTVTKEQDSLYSNLLATRAQIVDHYHLDSVCLGTTFDKSGVTTKLGEIIHNLSQDMKRESDQMYGVLQTFLKQSSYEWRVFSIELCKDALVACKTYSEVVIKQNTKLDKEREDLLSTITIMETTQQMLLKESLHTLEKAECHSIEAKYYLRLADTLQKISSKDTFLLVEYLRNTYTLHSLSEQACSIKLKIQFLKHIFEDHEENYCHHRYLKHIFREV